MRRRAKARASGPRQQRNNEPRRRCLPCASWISAVTRPTDRRPRIERTASAPGYSAGATYAVATDNALAAPDRHSKPSITTPPEVRARPLPSGPNGAAIELLRRLAQQVAHDISRASRPCRTPRGAPTSSGRASRPRSPALPSCARRRPGGRRAPRQHGSDAPTTRGPRRLRSGSAAPSSASSKAG